MNILPFGTSTDSPTVDAAPIEAFGCTVVDFNVSADWSSQAGSLSFRLIEDELEGDRLRIPVVGSPHNFELKDTNGNIIFQYIGLVESFSRNSSNSKTYSVTLTSPLTILDATQVVMDGFIGLGGSVEGVTTDGTISTTGIYPFAHRNPGFDVSESPGTNHWWNVSNLINVFGILESDDPLYAIPFAWDSFGNPILYSDFGFSSNSEDGIPLAKLMYGLHVGINHLPRINDLQRQRTHGGNLLFGRHNYDVNNDFEGTPYYYHFDALGFYNQISDILGPQFRVSGKNKSIREIITEICSEANLEYFVYIDIYNDSSIGDQTLQEYDPNWDRQANCSWGGLSTSKFTDGGNYGGTIRIQTVNRNSFSNLNRPFSNIAYNLIGLEVPDLKSPYWSGNYIHPGKRPIDDMSYGIPTNSSIYSDPLDSSGLSRSDDGFTEVGTRSVVNGGFFPVATGYWDSGKLNDLKITQSDISIRMNDNVTMKVITGGYQTRLVTVPRKNLKHYWGDIILPDASDPRETADTQTDSLGLNETSSRKIPVITPLLDPRDVDDFILIDMHDIFGSISISGVLKNGIYAASLFEIRLAMQSKFSWENFIAKYKYDKFRGLINYFYPNINTGSYSDGTSKAQKIASTETVNANGGLGYAGVNNVLNAGNSFSSIVSARLVETSDFEGEPIGGGVGLSSSVDYLLAEANVRDGILPLLYEKVKTIGDTHYGKSWYVPVPYMKTKEDLDGNNLVGNFKRSWEITDSAYVEPSQYYDRNIPQTNQFIADGKVRPFINYDHNFVTASGDTFKEQYADKLTSRVNGKTNTVFNFSEYDLNSLAVTKYGTYTIIHAEPESVDDKYSFVPYAYERFYDRTLLPYNDILTGEKKVYEYGLLTDAMGPIFAGQDAFQETTVEDPNQNENHDNLEGPSTGATPNPGWYDYVPTIGIPSKTSPNWLSATVSGIIGLDYSDNGRFCFPYIKVETSRTFLPQTKTGYATGNALGDIPSVGPFSMFVGGTLPRRQNLTTEDKINSMFSLFPICVPPKTISYAQISTRHVYGPWITSFNYISFRGKIEYEQDESLVPENFLIPMNFGQFGGFSLSQTSGFEGLNLAAQGRANAIDNFSLFAVEEGSFTMPGLPAIKRIGDGLYGLPQVTDIKINVSSDRVETSYSFKTISPRFNKTNRDLEKNLTKISNKIKKIKLR
jgi:hypothetical protein